MSFVAPVVGSKVFWFLVVIAVLAAVLGSVPRSNLSGDTWECREYNTDYSQRCLARSDTECGRFCFYAECILCSDGYHDHTVCGLDSCWTVTHRHGISPCLEWLWYLWDRPLDAQREFEELSSNYQQAFLFGAVHPEEARCVEAGAEVDLMHTVPYGSITSIPPLGEFKVKIGDSVDHQTRGSVDGELVYGGEAFAPGVAIPMLRGVHEVVGPPRAYLLDFSAPAGVHVQQRHWPHSGEVPDDFGDPFLELPPGNVVVVERDGLHSFQVRTAAGPGVDAEALAWSNVVNVVVGLKDTGPARALPPDAFTPQPVATPWLLPSPSPGVVRPPAPTIVDVLEDPLVPGDMVVTMAPGHVGRLEYRYWLHSGFPLSGYDAGWLTAPPLVGGTFVVKAPPNRVDLGPGGSAAPLGFVIPSYWDFDHPVFYNFQARVVTFVGSEPSNIVIAMAWTPRPHIVPRP